jgi:cysteine-rich repeat protein
MVEIGYKCEGSPSECTETTCGDGKTEGAEGCDDGNTMPFDGCDVRCLVEPNCEGDSGCTSSCGDGLVIDEGCDDGNNLDGDGCSSSCEVEEGYECTQPGGGETMEVPLVVRDFPASHADFENGISGSEAASQGIVDEDFDADGKPVYIGVDNDGYISTSDSFAEWFRDGSGVNTLVTTLTLWDNGEGGYVNRYHEDGSQWAYYDAETAIYCGPGGSECETQCTEEDYDVCLDPCTVWGDNTDACGVRMEMMDGNPLFFPADELTPASPENLAQIPPPTPTAG